MAEHPSAPPPAQRAPRQPWHDRWLLDAFRQAGHPSAEKVSPAPTAWESLEQAGIPSAEILQLACTLSGAPAAATGDTGPDVASLLPAAVARRYDVVPVRLDGRTLEVATSNPLAQNLERDLAFACARRVRVVVASPQDIRQLRERVYGATEAPASNKLAWVIANAGRPVYAAPTTGTAVTTLDRIIADAYEQRASDIHLEPNDGELLVRYRVDGVLHDVTRIPAEVAPLLMSRIKVAAGLDIADRLRPQDGRASTMFNGRQIDLRISTLPLGDRMEKAVIRILDATTTTLDLGALGFTPGERHRLNKLLAQTEGMLLVTGPTGSGKTTTLYSALHHVKSSATNIVTVEDPVEYRLEGVNQVQVNEKAGLTFASALRSILRQDPDVVLVGEIRDGETAGIAIKAAMTGHLVLSTLHTNDAPSAIGRLADIGSDLGALSGALKGVLAQRLVRKLCPECSVPVTLDELPPDQQVLLTGKKTDRLRREVGCAACRNTGYRGRMVVAEILVVNDEMQKAIARGASRNDLLDLAKQGGMHTLWEAGLNRVVAGTTSLHELLDNIQPPIGEEEMAQTDVDRLLKELRSKGGTAPAAPPAQLAAPIRPITPASAIALRPNGSGPRVLVAHDGREERRVLRQALEQQGCVVVEAADGEAAFNYARRLRPDAVVMEIALPRLDAIGLLQALVAESVGSRMFVYTEQNDEAMLGWARELGAFDTVHVSQGADLLAERVCAAIGMAGVAASTPAARVRQAS